MEEPTYLSLVRVIMEAVTRGILHVSDLNRDDLLAVHVRGS